MNRVGILYDNISGNTGDVAIGLSIKKILTHLNIEYDELVPGNFNPLDYDSIIIGGGHLIRESPDFFYDKFRIPGNHILNAMGILGDPKDLAYLKEYRYISVRSTGDKKKLEYLDADVHVVPCTTMLLEDLPDFNYPLKTPSLGIHIYPIFSSREEECQFIQWLSSLPFTIYLIPITHYSKDIKYLEYLHKKIPNSELLPIFSASEIFTIIGKFDYFISCSLHGGIFSYIHNVPFVLVDVIDKMQFFMKDRNLDSYLVKDYFELNHAFESLMREPPDYSSLILEDKRKLTEHIEILKSILTRNRIKPIRNRDISHEANYQIFYLLQQNTELRLQLNAIINHPVWKIYQRFVRTFAPAGSRQREWVLGFYHRFIKRPHKT